MQEMLLKWMRETREEYRISKIRLDLHRMAEMVRLEKALIYLKNEILKI